MYFVQCAPFVWVLFDVHCLFVDVQGCSMFLSHYLYIIIKFLCMFDEDRHGALYRSSFDCLVDAVLHVTGAHAVLPPHLLRHPGNPMAKLRGGSEVR